MKKFLTIIAIAMFSLCLIAISTAQDAGPQGGKLEGKRRSRPGVVKLMEKFQKDVLDSLNLSTDQRKKIDDLNKDLETKIKTIIQENKGTTGNKNLGAQRRDAMRDYNNSMQDILGADLWKQYRDGMLAKMKEAREKRAERQKAQNGLPKKDDDMGGAAPTGGKSKPPART